MPRVAKELSAIEIGRLSKPGLQSVGGVTGLFLQVGKGHARSWILRVVVAGKRRDIGLGGYPTITLSRARDAARDVREKIRQGVDPIAEKKAVKAQLEAEQKRQKTFNECAEGYIKSAREGWSHPKHEQQWRNTLSTYVSPVFGELPVAEIDLPLILKAIKPIWTEKNETASRVRNRIESVLSWATTHGYRHGENPARWRGHLDALLAKPSKVQKSKHHPALDFHQIGSFMADLRKHEGNAARALEFCILTASRSGEVRGARWDEIDMKGKLWVIPADRMKAGKEHRIPLSDDAVKLLQAVPRIESNDLMFVAPRGGQLTDVSLSKVVKRLHADRVESDGIGYIDKYTDNRTVTVHGFRSTFRDWAGETTAYAREVIEHALAHKLPDKSEASYARGTMFTKRCKLMDDWSRYVSMTISTGHNVTELRALYD